MAAPYRDGYKPAHQMTGKKRGPRGQFTGGRFLRPEPSEALPPGEGPNVADPDELPPPQNQGEGVWIEPTEEEADA